uniref:Major facilitator superfamily (MFS) profile domain-containing protein n=1 Tax=Bionectria ochroleuca TaxID=29856 RepID=A0A8H7MZJ6_BIOOC
MHDSEAISGSGMDVSSNVDSPQSQVRHLEKNVKDELVTATSVTQPSEEKDTLDGPVPNAKKSVPFMLAFAGLSAVMFVFHVDATCLGIALPRPWRHEFAVILGKPIVHPLQSRLTSGVGQHLRHFWAKPPLYLSIGLFFIGSIIFAIASNMDFLIAGRVLQGLGGGGIDVIVTVTIADMTTLEERAKYLGILAIPSAVGNILGPFVGALFSTYVTWRWIGWINLPILGLGFPLVCFFLRLRPVPNDGPLTDRLGRLDWLGMALVVIGIAIFVIPLSWAGSLFPWASWQTLVPMLLGVVVLVLFIYYEGKPTEPIMPHRLFHSKTARSTQIGGFLHGAVLISLLQYLPLLYQAVQLETVISAAVSLLPTVILSTIIAAVSMMMVPLFGGTGVLALFDVSSSSAMRYGLPILWGQGVSLLRLSMLPIQASVKHVNDTSLATGQFLTIRMFGGLVGLAISSAIFNTVFTTSISSAGVELVGPLAPLSDAANAVNFINELKSLDIASSELDPVLRVYLDCFRVIFYTMTGLSGLGLVTSMFMEEIDLKKQSLGNQRYEEN